MTPTTTSLLSEYYTDEQLARELDVDPRTLYRWRSLGEAPKHIKIGKTNYTHRDVTLAWLAAKQQVMA
jgi:hypothetical protein